MLAYLDRRLARTFTGSFPQGKEGATASRKWVMHLDGAGGTHPRCLLLSSSGLRLFRECSIWVNVLCGTVSTFSDSDAHAACLPHDAIAEHREAVCAEAVAACKQVHQTPEASEHTGTEPA